MKIKYLTIGLIAGILLATAGSSLAANIIERVTASIRTDYTVELDGKPIDLEKSPLVYDGSSYLPVREIAGILGHSVDFEKNTIILTKEVEQLSDEWISLGDLANVHNVFVSVGDIITIGDLSFPHPKENFEELTITTDNGSFQLKQLNSRLYVLKSEMKSLDLIQ